MTLFERLVVRLLFMVASTLVAEFTSGKAREMRDAELAEVSRLIAAGNL